MIVPAMKIAWNYTLFHVGNLVAIKYSSDLMLGTEGAVMS